LSLDGAARGTMGKMKSTPIRFLALLTLIGAIPLVLGAAEKREEAQAQILEQENIPCANCFFGPTKYYFCFAAGDKIFLAFDRVPTFNWTDSSKNYLGKVHNAWRPPTPSGQKLTIQYNDEHLWIPRADGKQIRMKLDYARDIFNEKRCRAAVKKQAGD
jgi:hypothetical protein